MGEPMSDIDHELNTLTDPRGKIDDPAKVAVPDDPAVKAADEIFYEHDPYRNRAAQLIRAAYAETVAERDRLRVGVETEAERKRGIYEHAANAVVERNAAVAEREKLRAELAALHQQVDDFNRGWTAAQQGLTEDQPEGAADEWSIGYAWFRYARIKSELAEAQENIKNRLAVNETLRTQLAEARAEIVSMKSSPELHGCPVTTTDPWDAIKREEAEKDDAAEIERLVLISLNYLPHPIDQDSYLWVTGLPSAIRAVRDAVLATVKPGTSEPMTEEEERRITTIVRAYYDDPSYRSGDVLGRVREIVARRIRPECKHERCPDCKMLMACVGVGKYRCYVCEPEPCGHVSLPLTEDEWHHVQCCIVDTAMPKLHEYLRDIVARRIRPACNCRDKVKELTEIIGEKNLEIIALTNQNANILKARIAPACSHLTLDADLTPEDVERLAEEARKAFFGDERLEWPWLTMPAETRESYRAQVRQLASEFRAGAKRGPVTDEEWDPNIEELIQDCEDCWREFFDCESDTDVERKLEDKLHEARNEVRRAINSLLTGEKGGTP
jgi:hypothetical protein